MRLTLLIVGFVSILGQVVLLRELNVAFYGVELIYLLAIGTWLLWTASGALVSRRALVPPRNGIRWLSAGCAVLLPTSVIFIRGIRSVFGGVPGAYLPFGEQLLGLVLGLMPVGLILGLLFQWAAKEYMAHGGTLPRAYAVESVGGLLGGLAATLALKAGIANSGIASVCAWVAAAGMLHGSPIRTAGRWRLAFVTMSAALLLAAPTLPTVDRYTAGWKLASSILEVRDTPYGRITVTALGSQVSVFENDVLSFETEGTPAEEFVNIAALQVDRLANVLILGGGIEGTVHEILRHPVDRIDYVELNPALPDLVLRYLPSALRGSFEDPRLRIFHVDPRDYLRHAGRYGLVLIGMPEPASGQTNRFFTREFFQACRTHLLPGGVVAFRLPSLENYWPPLFARRMGSIHRALRSAFPDVVVLPGSATIFLASDNPLPRDPELLAARFEKRGVSARLVSPAYLRYLYRNDRFQQIESRLEAVEAAPNSDARPVVYQHTLLLWLSKFFPDAGRWNMPQPAPGSGLALWLGIPSIVLALLLVAGRLRPRFGRILLVGIAGFAGMVLETLILLQYQVQRGVLYQDLGLLLTGFMAGLAGGALAAGGRSVSGEAVGMRRRTTVLLLLGFAALSAWLAGSLFTARSPGLAEALLLLVATGGLVAGVFTCASLQGTDDPRRRVGPLYAADLAAGCFGSLVSSLVLVPIVGLANTASLLIPLALLALLLV